MSAFLLLATTPQKYLPSPNATAANARRRQNGGHPRAPSQGTSLSPSLAVSTRTAHSSDSDNASTHTAATPTSSIQSCIASGRRTKTPFSDLSPFEARLLQFQNLAAAIYASKADRRATDMLQQAMVPGYEQRLATHELVSQLRFCYFQQFECRTSAINEILARTSAGMPRYLRELQRRQANEDKLEGSSRLRRKNLRLDEIKAADLATQLARGSTPKAMLGNFGSVLKRSPSLASIAMAPSSSSLSSFHSLRSTSTTSTESSWAMRDRDESTSALSHFSDSVPPIRSVLVHAAFWDNVYQDIKLEEAALARQMPPQAVAQAFFVELFDFAMYGWRVHRVRFSSLDSAGWDHDQTVELLRQSLVYVMNHDGLLLVEFARHVSTNFGAFALGDGEDVHRLLLVAVDAIVDNLAIEYYGCNGHERPLAVFHAFATTMVDMVMQRWDERAETAPQPAAVEKIEEKVVETEEIDESSTQKAPQKKAKRRWWRTKSADH